MLGQITLVTTTKYYYAFLNLELYERAYSRTFVRSVKSLGLHFVRKGKMSL